MSQVITANYTPFYNLSYAHMLNFLSNISGLCPSIPSGVHVNIMYTQAGLSSNKPIYTIVSAMIK